MKKIGWIGFGNMGVPMSYNLLNNGHEMMVYSRNIQKMGSKLDERFLWTDSLAELVAHSAYIFLMLPDDEACEEIVNRLTAFPLDKRLVINMSTISPDMSIHLAFLLKQHHTRYIEAPVSGSIKPAEDGNLVILTAGVKLDTDEVSDCFDAMGKKTIYLGEIGLAARAKIGINYYMSIIVFGLADTLNFMERCGVEKDQMLDVINSGACASGITMAKANSILNNDFAPAFPLKYMTKDLKLADRIGLKSSLGSLLLKSYQDANLEFGEDDLMAIIKHLR